MMEESTIIDSWNVFYSQYQNSKILSRHHGDIVGGDGGTSLLYDTGGTFAAELIKNCGLFGGDIIKFNHLLWKLEEICLPKIAVMYEIFKRSSGPISSQQDPSPSVPTQISNDISNLEKENVCLPQSKKAGSTNNTMNVLEDHALTETSDSQRQADKRSWTETPGLSEVQEDDALASVRRSGRSVKITPRFQDVGEMILKTIKPTPSAEATESKPVASIESGHNVVAIEQEGEAGKELQIISVKETDQVVQPQGGSEQEMEVEIQPQQTPELHSLEPVKPEPEFKVTLKPPCVCSLCKSFSCVSETELLDHWNKHEAVGKGDHPFQCSLCDEKFSSYSSLSSHFLKHLSTKRNFQCHTCKKKFKGSKALARHQKLKGHSDDTKGDQKSCPVCNVVLGDGQSLSSHMLQHAPLEGAYSCELCRQTFGTLGLVKNHLLSHIGLEIQKHSCLLCGKVFRLEKSLDRHIRKKHSKDCDELLVFRCRQCPKKFRSQEQLDYHSVRHSGVKPYSCDQCGKSFLREKGLACHKRMHEGGGFMCDVCGKSFVNQRVLDEHATIHTGERPHVCDVCGKSFRLLANLRYHKQVHNPTKSIKCPQCPKSFRDQRSFERHMMMHTGIKPWQCQVCGKSFVQEATLIKHMNLHNGENRHQCQVCLRSFVDKWGLMKHSTIHTGERPYECSVCGRTFRIKKGLEDHFKLHDTSLQLQCPLCPKSFVERRHLEHHLRVHRGEKAYVCEICGDRFVNSMSLKVHLRRHTGEKPYKCSYCPKTFNQHGTHAAHERYHRGERPYACDFCDAAFITRSQLNIHRRKHLNDRPYKCSQCDYAATTASLLKVHALKHSSEKPFRCSVCPAAFKRQNHLDVHARKHQVREEVVVGDENTSIIHITSDGRSGGIDPATAGTVTVVEVFQCSFCEASFPTQAGLEKHMKRHEIIVVTAASNQEGIFEIPAIEGAHGASSEVAYDIVLL